MLVSVFSLIEVVRGWLMPFPFWVRDFGRRGEYLARRHFHRRGYHLVAANWRHGRGELDLVMANARQLLFIEVKTRRIKTEWPARRIVGREQRQRLAKLAHVFLAQWPDDEFAWRFQVAHLGFMDGRRFKLELFELDLRPDR